MVTDDARLEARARFEHALAIVRRVARCECVYDSEGTRLPSWVVEDDPRVTAIEEIRKFTRVTEDDLDARTRSKAAEYDARMQPLADYMATLPRTLTDYRPRSSPVGRCDQGGGVALLRAELSSLRSAELAELDRRLVDIEKRLDRT